MGIDSLQDVRDVTIIAFTATGTVLFLIASVVALIVGVLLVGTVLRVNRTVRDNLQPTLEGVRHTVEDVRGTVSFISDYAVTPVVRAYGAYAGARRFLAVFMRIARPRRGK